MRNLEEGDGSIIASAKIWKYQWAPKRQCWQKDNTASVRELRSFT